MCTEISLQKWDGEISAVTKLKSSRPLVKNAFQKNNILISQPKHTLWILKRTVSMKWLISAPKTCA